MMIEQEVREYKQHLLANHIAGILTSKEVDDLADKYEADLLWELSVHA